MTACALVAAGNLLQMRHRSPLAQVVRDSGPPAGRAAFGSQARPVLSPGSNMRVVVISPFEVERTALADLLRGEGHLVTSAATPVEGVTLALTHRPDVIIADAQVPGLHGTEILRALTSAGALPRVILLCARENRVIDDRRVICLTKPIDVAELHRQVCASPAGSSALRRASAGAA